MASCRICGRKLGFLDPGSDGRCSSCALAEDNQAQFSSHVTAKAEEFQREAEIEAILVTTEMQPCIEIQKRIDIVSAECAYGLNVFKDLLAGMRNLVGGRSEVIESGMRDAKSAVIYELKREAHKIGANAVVGVPFSYTQIGDNGWNMILLVATGTAVQAGKLN